MSFWKTVFPKKFDEDNTPRIALYFFYLITAVTIIRSLVHLFSPDGGSQSIASIPIEQFSIDAQNTVIFMFAIWGLSQLLMGLVYLIVCFRYRNFVPLMYFFIFLEYLGRVLIGQTKSIVTESVPPGEIGNYVLIPLSLILFIYCVLAQPKTNG